MADAFRISRTRATRTRSSIDRDIAELAQRQHGVAARIQLRAAGVSRDAIHYRLSQGRLHQVHRGVYAVGHPTLTREGRWIAAVLATGPGAVLSHRAAAALWGIGSSDYLEVTAVTHRAVPGIRVHTSSLPPDEMTSVRAIPATGVWGTLLDLAAVLPPHQLERAVNEAERRGHADRLSLPDLLARYPRRAGSCAIKAILERLESGVLTR